MNQRLEQLEVKIAFLEQANAELSDLVYQQRQQLDALREQFAVLTGRFEAVQAQGTAYSAEEEKPPHY